MIKVPRSGSMLYICGKCRKEVEKDAKICSNCGARLGKIRCPFCNFTGELEDFKKDTCPKCGKKSKNVFSKTNIETFAKKNDGIISNRFFLLIFVLLLFCLIGIAVIFTVYFKIF